MTNQALCGRVWLLASFVGLFAVVLAAAYSGRAIADHDPGSDTVDFVAVDTDITANTATHVETVESCTSIPAGGSIVVDIVVDQVPAAGTVLFATDLHYDPSLLRVTAKDTALFLASGGPMIPFDSSDGVPDTDGDLRLDLLDLGSNVESGEGVLARITLESTGASGVSTLQLADVFYGGSVTLADSGGVPYGVDNAFDGTIAIGASCPSTVDVALTALNLTVPAGANAGVPFDATVDATIENLIASDPVNTDITISISPPPDCTAAGGNHLVVQDTVVTSGTPVTLPPQIFSVTCTDPSTHSFSVTAVAAADDPLATEVLPANNSNSAGPEFTPVLADVDLKVTSATMTVPDVQAGILFDFQGSVSVHNNGPAATTGATLTSTLTPPAGCQVVISNSLGQSVDLPVSSTVTANPVFKVSCEQPGDFTFNIQATVASGLHVTDPVPANNTASGSALVVAKIGACGPDPAPAGDITQNLSPQLLLLIQNLTGSGTPVPETHRTQLNCGYNLTIADQAQTPGAPCPVGLLVLEQPCSLRLDVDLTQPEPEARLNPVAVHFIPQAFDFATDAEIPNGSTNGFGNFGIQTDGGLKPNGTTCEIDILFPDTISYEGGITPNVPGSNLDSALTDPNVWPEDLNAERAFVEASFQPIPGVPGLTLHSRTIVPLELPGQPLPLNVLIWQVTNPAFQVITGAKWVLLAFPGDALNPDLPGSAGGNPDADDPPDPGTPLTTCSPHHVSLSFEGRVGAANAIACTLPGSHMTWALYEPDAVNVSGDEGPRSDVGLCELDADMDGLSGPAETYWGTDPLTADSDADTIPDGPDNCKNIPNTTQANADGDLFGDICDNCPAASNNSQLNSDTDILGDACDNCPTTTNPAQENTVHPASPAGDACEDPEPDGVADASDNCPDVANTDQANADGDAYGNACDNCPATAGVSQSDGDDDSLGDLCDNCPATENIGQENADGDPFGDVCDNCPATASASQLNSDGDPLGNACDNCPMIDNIGQENADGDPYGDLCDNCPATPTDWLVPVDDGDCDGFMNVTEAFIGTLPAVACAATSGTSDEPAPDVWPLDFNDNQRINTVDVGFYVPRLNAEAPDPPYDVRFDLTMDGTLNTIDIGKFVPFLNKVCAP